MDSVTYQDLLDFWFDPATASQWFAQDPAFDDLLRKRFYALYEQQTPWPQTPRGALARILVLDQLPRNFFRGSAQAFATDAEALALCKLALHQGWDQGLGQQERLFMGLPLMHSEQLADQLLSLQYYANEQDALVFAQQHYDVIKKFGRFPRRNKALGRLSTPEELAFLEKNEMAW